FDDPRLSHDDSIACAHCHVLGQGGADGKPKSTGIGGRVGEVNAPSVLNAKFNVKQFWDGRADTLEAQIDGPLTAANEMGASWPEVLAKLRATPEYVAAFRRAYGEDLITRENVKDAIATFERSLYPGPSRFDRFLLGDSRALSQIERDG